MENIILSTKRKDETLIINGRGREGALAIRFTQKLGVDRFMQKNMADKCYHVTRFKNWPL